ncbi:glycosyltransferase family 39 protein [Nautilia sp.]
MKKVLLTSVFFYLFLLWYGVNFLSYSIVDVRSIEHFPVLNYILNFSFLIFGKNDIGLRFPGVLTGFLSILLFYKITGFYLKKEKDRFFAVLIFMLIPGMIISSLIVNKSVYIIFLTLLFVLLYKYNKIVSYVMLGFLVFIDYSFISLYFALIFYAVYKKDNFLLVLSLLFLAINANYFNYDIGGKPKGHFLDLFGTYFLIFSPFVFIYFIFAIYKGFFDKKRDIIFFIAFFTFLISVLLSFRQRIKIDDYAPFTLVYVVYMVKYYLNSYRVRLPVFRKFYKILFFILFISLIVFDIALFLNRYTPARNLSSSYYFIKPLVFQLKQREINYIESDNKRLLKALEFYGLKKGKEYKIKYKKRENKVSIFHKNRKFLEIDVSKLNTI